MILADVFQLTLQVMPDVRGNHIILNIMKNHFLDVICPFEERCDVVFRPACDEYAETRDLGTAGDYISKDGFGILGDTLIQCLPYHQEGPGAGKTPDTSKMYLLHLASTRF